MKITLLILFSISALSAFAQPDDMPDTRKKIESFANLPKDAIRDEVSRFVLTGIDESVGKEPLKKISAYTLDNTQMILQGDTLKAVISIAPFEPAKHKLLFDEKYLVKIDKKPYYGGYPDVPKTYISKIIFLTGKDSITIPEAAYSDIYNLNFTYKDRAGVQRSTNGIYRSKDGKRIYLYMFCKDNTGNYEVTWIIQDKKYVRRVLDFGIMQ